MNLDAIRAELPVLERVAYLNAGTFGPLPRRTVSAMVSAHQAELTAGRFGTVYLEHVQSLRARSRKAFADLAGATSGDIALTRSTSEACSLAVESLALGPEDEIVTTDVEHFGLLAAIGASGARVRVARIRSRPAREAREAIEGKIGEKTRLIALSHVAWSTGQVLPVGELAGHGIPVLVDGAQSGGSIALDVPALRCAFYTLSGQKWLLGPDGTGALYVNPAILESLRVPVPSYFGTETRGDDGTSTPVAGAQRLEPGTIPAPSLAGLLASFGFANEVGEGRFEHARAMAERCRELLGRVVEVVTEPGQATLLSFVPRGDPVETVSTLAAHGVVVRDLPGLGWLRASVGFWTSENDLERLAGLL
jgi:L-cysteine/cystine lyase